MPRKQGPKKKDAPPPADRDAPAEADVDAHPFKPGSWLVVAWPPDGSERLATVIDRARVESDDRDAPDQHHVRKDDLQRRDAARWRYYVHYADFNRRMDEWVPLDRFDLGSVTEEGKLTRTSKRKYDHEEHEEEVARGRAPPPLGLEFTVGKMRCHHARAANARCPLRAVRPRHDRHDRHLLPGAPGGPLHASKPRAAGTACARHARRRVDF